MGWHLETTALKTNPLHKYQFAFRRGVSTEVAMAKAVDFIESAIYRGQMVLAVFCDIQAAFDTISIEEMITEMENRNFPSQFIKLYGHFLRRRCIKTRVLGIEKTRFLSKGCQQGACLSPLAWNVAYDRLVRKLNHGGSNEIFIAFADDGLGLIKGKYIKHMIEAGQKMLSVALEWGSEFKVKFCPEKTTAVMFGYLGKLEELPKLNINGVNLTFSDQAKYLGVTITKTLDWKPHIKDKISKTKRRLWQLKAITDQKWGPKPCLVDWTLEAVLIPMLTYGSVIWGGSKIWNYLKTELKRLLRHSLVAYAPMRRGTPTEGLEVILNKMPLDLLIIKQGLLGYLRIKNILGISWPG